MRDYKMANIVIFSNVAVCDFFCQNRRQLCAGGAIQESYYDVKIDLGNEHQKHMMVHFKSNEKMWHVIRRKKIIYLHEIHDNTPPVPIRQSCVHNFVQQCVHFQVQVWVQIWVWVLYFVSGEHIFGNRPKTDSDPHLITTPTK